MEICGGDLCSGSSFYFCRTEEPARVFGLNWDTVASSDGTVPRFCLRLVRRVSCRPNSR